MKAAALIKAPPIVIAILTMLRNSVTILYNRALLFAGGKDFWVLEVLFERNAASNNRGELRVVHRTAAGVGGEALFHDLFCDPANARGLAGESRSCNDRFQELIVGHGIEIWLKFKSSKQN